MPDEDKEQDKDEEKIEKVMPRAMEVGNNRGDGATSDLLLLTSYRSAQIHSIALISSSACFVRLMPSISVCLSPSYSMPM